MQKMDLLSMVQDFSFSFVFVKSVVASLKHCVCFHGTDLVDLQFDCGSTHLHDSTKDIGSSCGKARVAS